MIRFNVEVLDRIAYQRKFRKEYELADHLHINPGTLRNWRSGKTTPSFAYLSKMYLDDGIPFEEMISDDEEQEGQMAA